MKRARRDDGFTLVELLVAVTILGIIAAPLALAVITGLRVVGRSEQKFTDSRSGLISAADFASDVASSNSVSTGGAACGTGGTLLVTFSWNDPAVFPVATGSAYPNKVSYFYDNNSLLRRTCKNGAGESTSTAAVSLGSEPTVECFKSGAPDTPVPCNGDPDVRWVKLQVTSAANSPTPDNPAPDPYSFTLLGTRRTTLTRGVTPFRRSDSEAGASLVLALVMIVVIAVAIVATLAYASTSLHTVSVIKTQRQTLYAADGAVQTAIQVARRDGDAGAAEGNCGSLQSGLQYPSVGDQPPVSVSCEVVAARGIGVPGVDFPPYTILHDGRRDRRRARAAGSSSVARSLGHGGSPAAVSTSPATPRWRAAAARASSSPIPPT